MKQRCAILTCDYFQGGDCRQLCSLPKAQRIDTSALGNECIQVGHEPIERPSQPDNERESLFAAAGALVGAVALLGILAFSGLLQSLLG